MHQRQRAEGIITSTTEANNKYTSYNSSGSGMLPQVSWPFKKKWVAHSKEPAAPLGFTEIYSEFELIVKRLQLYCFGSLSLFLWSHSSGSCISKKSYKNHLYTTCPATDNREIDSD